MNPEDPVAFFRDNPVLTGYFAILTVGSLLSFIILLRQLVQENRIRTIRIGAWSLKTVDFLLYICAIIAWFGISGPIVLTLHDVIMGKDVTVSLGWTLAAGLFMQGGLLVLFFLFRSHFFTPGEGPLSPRLLSWGKAAAWGFYFFLATLPVVYAINIGWNLTLEMLRQMGFDLTLPMQEAVRLFQEADTVGQWIALILLATVVAPIVEEYVFRAGVYRFLKSRTRPFIAMLGSGLLFGSIHMSVLSLPGLVAVGVLLCFAYEQTGNLRVPIIFHACFNLNSVIWIFLLPEGLV